VDEEVHPHKPGSHGGIIIPIGSDSYHAEAVIETTGEFRLLMLGKDESRIQEVDVQPVKAYVKAIGDPNATPIELAAVPQDGDAPDKTSQFVGQLPEIFRGKQLDVTIPNLRIAGERFRVGFTTVTESHAEEMPGSLPADEERKLYLTAGGKYTEADIKANGGMTATQKFKGLSSSHDMVPKEGDRVCPVTQTKANPKFTWIVDGKSYQFCCPPCVDEFVAMAKERPEEVKDPEDYIKSNGIGFTVFLNHLSIGESENECFLEVFVLLCGTCDLCDVWQAANRKLRRHATEASAHVESGRSWSCRA
jgi:hypothetical protein